MIIFRYILTAAIAIEVLVASELLTQGRYGSQGIAQYEGSPEGSPSHSSITMHFDFNQRLPTVTRYDHYIIKLQNGNKEVASLRWERLYH